MALETLKGRTFGEFVTIDHKSNTITFKIQDGPIKEAGLNGCQVDDLISVAHSIIYGLNEKFPCQENVHAISFLLDASGCLKERTRRREAEGIEGTSQEMTEPTSDTPTENTDSSE